MRFDQLTALTDHEPRGFQRRHMYEALRGLFAENAAAPAAGGGAAAAAVVADPAAAPVAAAPAAAPGAAPPAKIDDKAAAAPAAGDAASKVAALDPLIDPKAAPPVVVTPDDQKKLLIEKGAKAEDLDKLKPEELQAKYDEAKKADEGKPAAPADYEIKVPEGIEIDEKAVTDFKAIMADDKLSPADRANKLVEMHAAALKASAEKPMQLWFDTQKKWQDEVRADKEIGGTNLDANRSNIAKAITDIMGDQAAATFEALKYTGAANHPAIVRLFARMSKVFVEGGPAAGSAPGAGHSKDFATRVAAMYPSATGSQQSAG